jgi:hypothetical protein
MMTEEERVTVNIDAIEPECIFTTRLREFMRSRATIGDEEAERRRWSEIRSCQREIAWNFGIDNGWKLARRDFSVECLAKRGHHDGGRRDYTFDREALDHPYYYRTPNGRAAAIVAHLYAAGEENVERRAKLRAWADGRRLKASFPNFVSWHNPGGTTLVLYEPPMPRCICGQSRRN